MEEEIDLRIYIDTLLKWWWLIALGLLLSGGMAYVYSALQAPVYEASAGVVMLKSRADISLGSGFETLTEEDLGAAVSSASLERNKQRLNTLTGMVRNGAIAQQVAEELSSILGEDEQDPANLVGYVKGEVLNLDQGGASDTIEVVVSHTDPEKAAAIANAWAAAFEDHVNNIYGDASISPFADIGKQVQETRAEYDTAQEALLKFLSEDDQVYELQRQIEEEEAVIASLRKARQTALAAVVDKEVEVKQKLIAAYMEDDINNRLFSFDKGQEAKRQILGTWIDAEVANRIAAINRDRNVRLRLFETAVAAEIDARLQVFEQQRDAVMYDLEQDYTRKDRLETYLSEARLMREQLLAGGEAAARSNGMALWALKSQVFTATQSLPFETLDLQITSVDDLQSTVSAAEQLQDVEALITTLEQEIIALDTSIQEQSDAMLRGEGYDFLELLSPEHLALASTGVITDINNGLTGGESVSLTLGAYVLERYEDLFNIGGVALSAENVAVDTPLFQEIQSLYPDLFTRDAWMQLAESVPDETELGNLATQMAEDLLKMRGLEGLLTFSVLDEPLSQEIVRREANVRLLQADVARLNQVKTDLQQDRDLAWDAYSNLLSKEQELRITSASEGSEVRFASPALPPRRPVRPEKKKNTAIGLAAGLMLAVFAAFLFEYIGLESHPRRLWKQMRGALGSAQS